jgi:hypothetical protein
MRLLWNVASLIMVTASVVHAQMPSTTRVPARGGDLVIGALEHASVQIEHGATMAARSLWAVPLLARTGTARNDKRRS